MDKLKKITSLKSFWWNLIIILLLLFFVLFRFIIFSTEQAVHYHANFQIYIHGEVLVFDNPAYYEEVSACTTTNVGRPSSRVHMHDNVSHLIHVHDHAVTYNHFFNNLGFNLSNETLTTNAETYLHNRDGQLRFILNGRLVVSMNNKLIQSEDVLLIDFSDDDLSILMERYNQIPQDADEANLLQDPQSCLGNGQSDSFWNKFKQALGF